jgi:hypothetical protein
MHENSSSYGVCCDERRIVNGLGLVSMTDGFHEGHFEYPYTKLVTNLKALLLRGFDSFGLPGYDFCLRVTAACVSGGPGPDSMVAASGKR